MIDYEVKCAELVFRWRHGGTSEVMYTFPAEME
jgi:hypothetical protein